MSRKRQRRNWFFGLILGVLFLPLVLMAIGLAIFFIPYAVWLAIKAKFAEIRFRKNNVGRWFFVCTRRRGWHEFTLNNVVPILPVKASVIWFEQAIKQTNKSDETAALSFVGNRRIGVSKPFVIQVLPRELRLVPLHAFLKPLQNNRKRRDLIQLAVKKLLDEALSASMANRADI